MRHRVRHPEQYADEIRDDFQRLKCWSQEMEAKLRAASEKLQRPKPTPIAPAIVMPPAPPPDSGLTHWA